MVVVGERVTFVQPWALHLMLDCFKIPSIFQAYNKNITYNSALIRNVYMTTLLTLGLEPVMLKTRLQISSIMINFKFILFYSHTQSALFASKSRIRGFYPL